jgi:hypothetical protein
MQTLKTMPQIGGLAEVKGAAKPPVHLWNPPFCGDIDMRIAADGTWYYLGTPITRAPMVRLFASILRKDPERFVLVTPVEMVGIVVEDAPFIATEMSIDGVGHSRRLLFRTNVEDEVVADETHPIRFERQANDGFKPYVMVRDGLWAKLTRSLYAELVDHGEVVEMAAGRFFGVFGQNSFFPIAPADELEFDA